MNGTNAHARGSQESELMEGLGRHSSLRNVRQGPHVRMCRSCYRENAAWVLKDQNPGAHRCPFSNDRWEILPAVVGKNWEERYRTMIETVGPSSSPKNRLEVAHATLEAGVLEPAIAKVEA